jgi:cytochrome c6
MLLILRRVVFTLLLTIAVIGVANLFNLSPVYAADLADGAKVFSANCAACHANGRNVISADKTLQKDALDKYGMASLDAIKTQVTNGKNAMPAFKGRLTEQQIENVATYVLDQANKGW